MSEIKTSFSFSLGTSTEHSISAEIDTRTAYENGDNATRLGKTSGFDSGDSIAFLVYLPPELVVKYVATSLDGIGASISWHGATSVIKTEEKTFESRNNTEAKLSHHVATNTNLSGQWIGNNLGTVTLLNDQITIRLPQLPPNYTVEEQRMTGIYKVSYRARAHLFRLNTPRRSAMITYGKPPYPINIVIYCEES